MNLLDPQSLVGKLILLFPIVICIFSTLLIKISDGEFISGFNNLEEFEKKELKESGYVKKTIYLSLAINLPLLLVFLLSFFIKDINLFNKIIIIGWILFTLILFSGLFVISRTSKK
ncbi:MAG: DUF3784 domain-containing protein [Peptoniphilaceae bacterium]